MSVSNLIYPQWHPVSCNDCIPVDLLCINQEYNDSLYEAVQTIDLNLFNTSNMSRNINCDKHNNNNCYHLLIQKDNSKIVSKYVGKSDKGFMNAIFSLFTLVNHVVCFISKMCHSFTHKFQSQSDVKESVTKICITSVPMQNVLFNVDSFEIQVYECDNGEYISMKMFHNNVLNCDSEVDETSLTCFVNEKIIIEMYCEYLV